MICLQCDNHKRIGCVRCNDPTTTGMFRVLWAAYWLSTEANKHCHDKCAG